MNDSVLRFRSCVHPLKQPRRCPQDQIKTVLIIQNRRLLEGGEGVGQGRAAQQKLPGGIGNGITGFSIVLAVPQLLSAQFRMVYMEEYRVTSCVAEQKKLTG